MRDLPLRHRSQHTVHRRLANMLRKLGLPSRAAAVAGGARVRLV
jgi:DNA-binding CsgD family transcriptional regulator